MATIDEFTVLPQRAERAQPSSDAAIVLLEIDGQRYVQLNGYGSSTRVNVGARSQNMRLTKAAFDQLVALGQKHFDEGK